MPIIVPTALWDIRWNSSKGIGQQFGRAQLDTIYNPRDAPRLVIETTRQLPIFDGWTRITGHAITDRRAGPALEKFGHAIRRSGVADEPIGLFPGRYPALDHAFLTVEGGLRIGSIRGARKSAFDRVLEAVQTLRHDLKDANVPDVPRDRRGELNKPSFWDL